VFPTVSRFSQRAKHKPYQAIKLCERAASIARFIFITTTTETETETISRIVIGVCSPSQITSPYTELKTYEFLDSEKYAG